MTAGNLKFRKLILTCVILLITQWQSFAAEKVWSEDLVGTWRSDTGIIGEMSYRKDGSFQLDLKEPTGRVFYSDRGIWKIEGNVLLRQVEYTLEFPLKGGVIRTTSKNRDWMRTHIIEITQKEIRIAKEESGGTSTWTRVKGNKNK